MILYKSDSRCGAVICITGESVRNCVGSAGPVDGGRDRFQSLVRAASPWGLLHLEVALDVNALA